MIGQSKRIHFLHYFGLYSGIIFVSTAAILIRFAQNDVSSLVISAYRLTISSLILGVFVFFKGTHILKKIQGKNLILAIAAGCFLAVHFSSWVTSLEYTSIASSVVLVTTTPLWVTIFAHFIYKEKITKNIFIGLIIALMGGIIVAFNEICVYEQGQLHCSGISNMISGQAILGNGLALLGAFAAAGYMLIGRKLRKDIDTLPYTFVVYGFSAIILDFVVIIKSENLFKFSTQSFVWLFLLAIIPQLFGHSIFNWALRFFPASIVSIALLGEPVGSTILAMIILKESPTIIEVVGGVLILMGITFASINRKTINEV